MANEFTKVSVSSTWNPEGYVETTVVAIDISGRILKLNDNCDKWEKLPKHPVELEQELLKKLKEEKNDQ